MASHHQIRAVSLTEAAYSALREEILAGRIPPGESVTELGLAERFAVARPTVKAAVERLVSEGLLVRTMHRSAQVPGLTTEQILDVFALREILERTAIETLTERREVPREAERAVHEMADADGTRDVAGIVEADVRFHRALVAAVGSPRLERAHAQIMGEAQLAIVNDKVVLTSQSVGIAPEHEEILDAIRSGDVDRARGVINEHLQGVCRRLTERENAAEGGEDPGPAPQG